MNSAEYTHKQVATTVGNARQYVVKVALCIRSGLRSSIRTWRSAETQNTTCTLIY